MALTYSNLKSGIFQAPEFSLQGVDGQIYSLSNFASSKALLIVFMCNHCPYVKAVTGRINQIAKDYAAKGVMVVGINSNDADNYPEDSFDKMKEYSDRDGYVFPYLFDNEQAVAKSYEAACTPDPYLFKNEAGRFILAYQGRIDDNWQDETKVTQHSLRDAIESLLAGKPIELNLKPSMGCNIKWKK